MKLGAPEWMYDRYLEPHKGKKTKTDHVCREIFCCAYREYDESKGATGGPGGVLHMQERLLGKRFKGIRVQYLYKPSDYRVPDVIWEEMNALDFKIKLVIAGAGYILTNEEISDSIIKGNAPFLVCHDLGTAYGAYLLGLKYIVIYHQQGSLLNEIVSGGGIYTEFDEQVLDAIEKQVISNAEKIYFPSKGARETFIDTTKTILDDSGADKLSDIPVYNTIDEELHIHDIGPLLKQWDIDVMASEEIFISVGDYIKDKGLDRIPSFLDLYQKKTGNKVKWIVVGNNTGEDMRSVILDACKRADISCCLIPERIQHEDVLALVNQSDYYIMLHRKSIFDLATLEAMKVGKKLILSDCTANSEFNVMDNVELVSDDMEQAVDQITRRVGLEWSDSNRRAYKHFFDNRAYQKRFAHILQKHLMGENIAGMYQSSVNKRNLTEWKDKYKGKRCIICGSGQSLDYIKKQDRECIYIALNKALFYSKIHFDFLFMQDMPQNQPYTLEDYNSYDCIKFYGIITNKDIKVEGLGNEAREFQNVKNRIFRYELSPQLFDYRVDELEKDIANNYIADAQSILFSALQFALYAGFTDIQLCGVDFSDTNYGNVDNPSIYARNVCDNLIELKRQWKEKYDNVYLRFYHTSNEYLKEKFYEIDYEDKPVIVSGIFTANYRNMIKMEEQSCRDGYQFDFRYISDEEWIRRKGNGEFAFFGGNTIKAQLVVDKIQENMGNVIIITDADVIFLKETRGRIILELEDVDMLFLRERGEMEMKYEKAVENINIGFVVINCNDRSLQFWKTVVKTNEKEKGWDQEVVNELLHKRKINLRWKLLSEEFHNGGSINVNNFSEQRICTACGTIAERRGVSKEEYLIDVFNHFQENKFWS